MAFCTHWKALGTLLAGVGLASACAPDTSSFGPPEDADTSTLTEGGYGGAGGAGTGNACACAYEAALGKPDCAMCINGLAQVGKCGDEIFQCESSMACLGILQCPVKCYGKAGAELDACVEACYANPTDQEAYSRFKNLMGCACPVCGQECSTSKVVTCP